MVPTDQCPECELKRPLSEFVPRDGSVYERERVPRIDEVRRQSRCRACDHIAGRRRRFVIEGKLKRLARKLGLVIENVKGSCFRKVRVVKGRLTAERRARVLAEIKSFNDQLPEDRCEVERHGIELRRRGPRVKAPDFSELPLFSPGAWRA